jgi:hypothetical protein
VIAMLNLLSGNRRNSSLLVALILNQVGRQFEFPDGRYDSSFHWDRGRPRPPCLRRLFSLGLERFSLSFRLNAMRARPPAVPIRSRQ